MQNQNAELIAELIAEPFSEPAYLYCLIAISIPVQNPCRTRAEPLQNPCRTLQNCAEPLAECVQAGIKLRGAFWRSFVYKHYSSLSGCL